ncbi:GRAM domain family protein [Actinidia rufa]|uniref:GRAM domain family protein n=1 Tax=Actinidia rufa TaxID=165716 RepID=A0A7J0EKY9_9ERIC|nr:GRAM domain family protein [Actinidia rufa]
MNHTSNQESQPHYPSLAAFPTPTSQEPVLDQPPPPSSVSPPPYPQETQTHHHAAGPSHSGHLQHLNQPRNGGPISWAHLPSPPATPAIKRLPYGVPTISPSTTTTPTFTTLPLRNQPPVQWNLYFRCSTPGATRPSPPPKISGTIVFKTGSSVPGAAWNKVNLTAKAITGGGFESLYKQTFTTFPNEKLKKTFACYLSTTTGPVAGTLYLSNAHAAFCSDRPLSFTAPSGQESWSYYKIMVPLGKICAINPVVMRDNPSEKYLQIVTIDGHDFWFMGFVNYEKATRHLSESLGSFVAPGIAVQPVVT